MSLRTHLKVLAKTKKVLVVDDDPQILEVLKDILEQTFAQVTTATNGQEALDIYQRAKFDLVISDIRMPKIDGIELSHRLRDINSEQAIIVASAHNDSEYLMDLISLGVNDFVLKPFDMEQFYKKLIKVLEYVLHKKELERLRFKQFAKALRYGGTENAPKNEAEKVCSKSRSQRIMEEVINHDIENVQKEMSASEYMDNIQKNDKELWELLQNEMEEIILLGDDFEEYINTMLLAGIDENTIEQVASILKKYSHIFIHFDSFKTISVCFEDLSTILMQIDTNSLTEEKTKALEILEYIWEDIRDFVNGVFIKKDVKDIFFFQHSITATTEQLKLGLGLIEHKESLELF
jgi:YesN/AraC family two-component response regulator